MSHPEADRIYKSSERKRAYMKEYNKKRREQTREYDKAYREAHRNELLAYQRAYYADPVNKARRAAYLKAYREDPVNKERKRAYMRARYQDPNERARMKRDTAAARDKKVAALRPLIDTAKTSGCSRCSERDPCCLVFHHRDPDAKAFDIGRYLTHMRLGRDPGFKKHQEVLATEIAKCDVLCRNCHAKLHEYELPIRRGRSASYR